MEDHMLKELNKLLLNFRHIKRISPIKPPLKDISEFKCLPFTTKDDLRNFDMRLSPSPVFHVTATSGTTSSRLFIAHSKEAYECHLEKLKESYKLAGAKRGDLCFNSCSYSLNSGGFLMETAFKMAGAGVIPFGVLDSKDRFNEAAGVIRALNPNFLNAYTNQLYDLFSLLKQGHKIKKCVVSGEPLFPSFKKEIEKLGGMEIYDHYGSMEFSGFAMSESSSDEYMRIFEQGLYIEVLKDDGSTDETGRGKIVITDIENTCMPFIRYILGDVVEIIERGKKKYVRVLGRTEDSVLIEGEVYSKIWLVKLIQDFLKNPNFFILLYKDRTTYKDKIVVNITPKDKNIRDKLIGFIRERLPFSYLVKVAVYSGKIPKTSTGKIKSVIDLRKNEC